MKKNTLKSLLVIGTVFVMTGCGGGSSPVSDVSMDLGDPLVESAVETLTDGNDLASELPTDVSDAIDAPASILSEDLKDSITFMYNEESLAYDVYMNIYKIQAVQQLQKIAENSETKHIQAVDELAVKYDLNMTTYDPTLEPYDKEGIGNGKYSVQHIQDLYDALYDKGIKSKKDALEVGCMVEVVDVDDLEKYIALATESNATDVLGVFTFLINGSYNHYWSFNDALKKLNDPIGLDERAGCCSVVDEFYLGYDFCQLDYPKK